MTAILMSGKDASAALLEKLARETKALTASGARPPKLVVVQVGADPASGTYIRQKERAAAQCGFAFEHLVCPRDITGDKLTAELKKRADDPHVDGIILQLPIDSTNIDPKTADRYLKLIPPEKDADGLDALNQGYLFTGVSTASSEAPSAHPLPATALGVMRLLQHYKMDVKGLRATVVGRSRLVGAPVAMLLVHAGATVTVAHRGTRDLRAQTKNSELIVACAGVRHLLKTDDISPGTILVDVGIHVGTDGKLTGDIDPKAFAHAKAYSPVPGGVGPMTVAGLMENTLQLRKRRPA